MLWRPAIFLHPIFGIIARLLWLILLVFGLLIIQEEYVNLAYIIILFFVIIAAATVNNYSVGTRAKTIIKIYKELLIAKPRANDQEILKQTAKKFLELQGRSETDINSMVESIWDYMGLKITRINNIEDLILYLLLQIYPSNEITSRDEEKIEKAILNASRTLARS